MKTDFLALTPNELEAEILRLGYPKFRATQIYEQMYKGRDFSEMSTLPQKMRLQLAETALVNIPKIKRKLVSAIDGTVKYLFELSDGNYIESVVMRYKYGLTICISSQVGCRMGCKFCASTLDGKVRDLLAGELLGQIIAASCDLNERISHVVMMGIGEPLDNYDNVIRFLRLVNRADGLGISYRSVSLSTCGVVPKIYALAKENLPITLSISLHSANDKLRSEIMPINRSYGVAELLTACNDYFNETGRRISFEYTLIAGKNDSRTEATELAHTLKKYMKCPFHVNLIPLNTVAEREFKTVNKKSAVAFCKALCENGVNATIRRTLGADINASCGQLRRKEEKNTSTK